jgi:hypothetical protein
MSAARPRMDTPVASESEAVAPNLTDDFTEPAPAPERRATPVPPPQAMAVRSRKATLVSPIPALLAASMKDSRLGQGGHDGHDGRSPLDATPLPADARIDVTSRLTDDARESLLATEAGEYLVEVDAHKIDG